MRHAPVEFALSLHLGQEGMFNYLRICLKTRTFLAISTKTVERRFQRSLIYYLLKKAYAICSLSLIDIHHIQDIP